MGRGTNVRAEGQEEGSTCGRGARCAAAACRRPLPTSSASLSCWPWQKEGAGNYACWAVGAQTFSVRLLAAHLPRAGLGVRAAASVLFIGGAAGGPLRYVHC